MSTLQLCSACVYVLAERIRLLVLLLHLPLPPQLLPLLPLYLLLHLLLPPTTTRLPEECSFNHIFWTASLSTCMLCDSDSNSNSKVELLS